MKILITGANGFIGSNLIQTFLAGSDHQLVAGANNTDKAKQMYGGEARVQVKHLDVLSPDSLDKA